MRFTWPFGRRDPEPPSLPPEEFPPDEFPPGGFPADAPAPAADPTDGQAYPTSRAHLWDELERVDRLVRLQLGRWRGGIGTTKPAALWGMPTIGEPEVEAYLAAPFAIPAAADPWTLRDRDAEVIARTIDARIRATPQGVDLRLERLVATFRLNGLERDILLACLLPEIDGRYRRLYAFLDDDASRRRPSVELILQIVDRGRGLTGPGREALLATAPLIAGRLIDLGSDDEPLTHRSIGIDPRIADFLLDLDEPDARIATLVAGPAEVLGWDAVHVDGPLRDQLRAAAAWWTDRTRAGGASATAFLQGADGSGRLAAARAICTEVGLPLLVADACRIASSHAWAEALERVHREALLHGAALYWQRCEALLRDPADEERWTRLTTLAEHLRGLVFLASDVAWDPVGRFQESPFLRFVFPVPDFGARKAIWVAAMDDAATLPDLEERGSVAEQLAAAFRLTSGQVDDAIAAATARSYLRPDRTVTADDLAASARRQSGRLLGGLGRRIEPDEALRFDDLVLPPANLLQLEELRRRIRLRPIVDAELGRTTGANGLVALFTGSSGTGKTMAAQLLAKDQGVDLFKVDMSAIVDKFVGETEKKLKRAFDEAELMDSVLFFDEADAIFGRRGEIRSAQDRWANLEVNYLLQRVEEYTGVVVLATNLRQNIDDAFLRRIQFQVEFPAPDSVARLRILERLLPDPDRRPSDEELRAFATRFDLSGGNLRNIAADATFRAYVDPDETVRVRILDLIAATAREYQKLGRPITPSEFGGEFFAYVQRELLAPKSGVTTAVVA